MSQEDDYMLLRFDLISARLKAKFKGNFVGGDHIFMMWRMQYWQNYAKYLESKIEHQCTDANCGICDPGWEKFLACKADDYKITRLDK